MMTADLLADWSNYVIVSDTQWADGLRILIGITAAMTAVLLARLYLGHQTGRMNAWAAVGAVGTYLVVAWAQIIATTSPTNDITLLNVVVLAAVGVSLYGTLRVMKVSLFRRDG
jgi:hypothetical protein